MDAMEELKSTALYRHLHAQSQDYARRIATFVNSIAPILATTQTHFPYYTRHDAHHGFRVTKRIGQVLNPRCLGLGNGISLGHIELFLLIAAAYAHDLGMTVFPGEAESLRKELGLEDAGWELDARLTGYLRENHSNRGGRYILENAKALGVPDNLVSPLDAMMRSHNLSIAELDQSLREPFAAAEKIVDVRQLAAVLCIGDAIEFSDTRVLDGVLDLVKTDRSQAARISYRENRKHDCIRDSLALDDAGQVVVSGTFTEPDVLALAHRTFDQMEEWIRGYCDIDRSSKLPRLQVRPEPFRRRLDLLGARFERLGVRMSKRSVIDLIASNAVWRDDPGIALRELIQNSIEACRYRAHRSGEADAYRPHVRVVFDRESRRISVCDNGCGMSESTVLNNLLTVGNSRSKEAAYLQGDYAPIARFGIGFWSVFTIAEQATVETAEFENNRESDVERPGEGIRFDVELNELKDYTVFESKKVSVGTTVILHLKPDVVLDDVFERARGHLLAAEVGLTLVLDGEEMEIDRKVPDVTDEILFGARTRAMLAARVEVFQWRGERDGVDLSMALAYRMENSSPTFRVNAHQSLLSAFSGVHIIRSAVCGFATPAVHGRTSFAIERVGGVYANVRSPRGLAFSLDRRQLTNNEALRRFSGNVVDLIHAGYRDFLASKQVSAARDIYRLTTESEMNGGNVFDQYTGAELAQARDRWPDLLCFRLMPVAESTVSEEDGSVFVTLEQLLKQEGHCWVIQNRIDENQPNGLIRSIHSEHLHSLAMRLLQGELANALPTGPNFVLEANRQASMLFDGDPDSTVVIANVAIPGFGNTIQVCLQRINLSNITFNTTLHEVLAEVRGRWTGTIFLRNFEREGKPYMFLGRYRVLIKRSSRLHGYIAELKSDGRLAQIATVVHALTEHDAGFTTQPVSALL